MARREHATHGRIECLPRVAELRLDWLAGRRTRLEEDYATPAHAHPDAKQINVDRALRQGHLAFAQGRRSLVHDHLATATAAASGTSEVDVSTRIAAALAAFQLAEGAPQAAWAIAEDAPQAAWAIAEPALSTIRGLRSAPAASAELAPARGVLLAPPSRRGPPSTSPRHSTGGRTSAAPTRSPRPPNAEVKP
ncbi:hypothetical protein [Streptomyces griseorubiginosus]|uniref:hypothetical protein n=1 Tax=Streptomyces griseorubiginosus TaxID=67304 RepID=UPI0033EA2FB5